MSSAEYQVVFEETPFGVTFFEGLDIPLVEAVSAKGAAASCCARGGRRVRVGDRLVAINGACSCCGDCLSGAVAAWWLPRRRLHPPSPCTRLLAGS
jgi:hypothetical protein